MKINLKERIEQHWVYPCLGIATNGSNKIVLFHTTGEGVLIANPAADEYTGYYYRAWNMIMFEKYTGSITLEND